MSRKIAVNTGVGRTGAEVTGTRDQETGKINLDVISRDPNIGVFGETVVATRSHDISVAFNYNISDHDVDVVTTGTGTAVYDQNTLKITPGTGIGLSQVQSHNTVAYRPGSEAFGMFTACFENGGEAGLIQGAGLMDPSNGFWLGYNGTTFSVVLRKAGSDTYESDFNGADISWLDYTKLNIYMIRYGWLGIAPVTYWVYYGPTRSWKLIHCTDLTNKQTLPHINTPTLPVCFFSERTSGTGTASVIRSGSWRGGILNGAGSDFHRHFSYSNTKTTVGTTLTNIFTISNKAIYQGVTNRVNLIVELISVAVDGTKPAEFSVWENVTLGGTPAYTDIETANSVSEVDVAGTTVTGGEVRFTSFLGKVDGETVDMLKYNYILHPGETFTFAAKATSGTTDVSYSANWGELF